MTPEGNASSPFTSNKVRKVVQHEQFPENNSIKLEDHPHCRQLNASVCTPADREPREWNSGLRYLQSWPSMPYIKRPDNERSSNHWGQLKLAESELFVLHPFASARVIYAGAAPGKHLLILMKQFPQHRFECYDPAPYDKSVSAMAGPRLKLVNDFFTLEEAKRIAEDRGCDPLVFVCDIRTADPACMKNDEVEAAVKRDQERQMEWARTLNADCSLLKFRLPWGEGTTNYLDGKILVQVYPPCTSTETRLVCTQEDLSRPLKAYNQKEYEEQLMWHNTVQRAQLFPHDIKVKGLDYCYDCRALVDTMSKIHRSDKTEDIQSAIEALIAEINDNGRTLATKYAVSSSRRGPKFDRKRFRDADGNDHFSMAKRKDA